MPQRFTRRKPVPRSSVRPSVAPPPGALSPWVLLRSANYHPFIYKRMIDGADPKARPGDVVNVYDRSGRLFGRGLYNPRSQIVLRMLVHGDAPVDDAFWRTAVARAVDLRHRLNLDAVTDAYRLVHAEGDGLSGLVVERYADWRVFEVFALGMFQRVEMFADLLGDALGPPSSLDRPGRASKKWQTLVRADPHIEKIEGFAAPVEPSGPKPLALTIREHGIRYRVDIAGGHKTGFFCDQRDNRRMFAALTKDANVLDLCCYTAGFGLCAKILGEAEEVTSVDLDEAALAIAKENANLNNARISLVHSDAFIYLRQMIANGRQFDAVVLDPPKLATSREEIDDALRKYHDLNALAAQVVRPGGFFLTCSCSGLVSPPLFSETIARALRRVGRTGQVFNEAGAAPDHPVMTTCPESQYLKALWMRVM